MADKSAGLISSSASMRDKSLVGQTYTVYGGRMSYFTQKVLVGFAWHLPGRCKYVPKMHASDSNLLEKRAGTHQIPVIETPENWVIADSTPIFHLLDSRLVKPKFYPEDAFTASVVALLEEYFDEWMARLVIHTRWSRDETGMDAALKMVAEAFGNRPPDEAAKAVAQQTANWGKRAIRALGMGSERQQKAGDEELLRLMTAFSDHLADGNRFLLGDSPCAVDCVLMGGLRAHFLEDIYPAQLLSGARLAPLRRWLDEFDRSVPDEAVARPLNPEALPPFVELVLTEMGMGYRNFVLSNAASLHRGDKSFVANVYGEDVSYLCRPYVQKSRDMLRESLWLKLQRADASSAAGVTGMLAKYQLVDIYGPQAVAKL